MMEVAVEVHNGHQPYGYHRGRGTSTPIATHQDNITMSPTYHHQDNFTISPTYHHQDINMSPIYHLDNNMSPVYHHQDITMSPTPHHRTICECCPYGYHIDLDFVRFCEKMARDSGEPSTSKRQRRDRRRQRQSMEVLLGLTTPVVHLWNIESLLPQMICESSEPPTPPVRTSSLGQGYDSLNKAVEDFEATLERTGKKAHDVYGRLTPPMSRSLTTGPDVGSLVSICSVGSGVSTTPLQNIREQMAISLERMKELEEKVKMMPALELQVASLKEEKSRLLREYKEYKSASIRAEQRQDRSKQRSTSREKVTREVGVLCSVRTRDSGVTPWVTNTCSVGTDPNVTYTCSVGTDTHDIDSTDQRTEGDVETNSKTKRLSLKDLDVVAPRGDTYSRGIQVTIRDPVLRVIEKRDAGAQTETAKQFRHVGITAKCVVLDVATEARPKTRDVAVSQDTTTDVLCNKCTNVSTRSVGVGYGNVKSDYKEPFLGPPSRSKSFDYSGPDKSKHRATRNIAVGTVAPVIKLTANKNLDTVDLVAATTRHVGVSTNKKKLVDTAAGEDTPMVPSLPSQTLAAPAASAVNSQSGSLPSKIPRPKTTTPVLGRKKIQRRDTYTKINPSQLLQEAMDTKTVNFK